MAHRPSCSAACGDPPRPGLEPVSPALAGGLSTTAPPGKPYLFFYQVNSYMGPDQTRASPGSTFLDSWGHRDRRLKNTGLITLSLLQIRRQRPGVGQRPVQAHGGRSWQSGFRDASCWVWHALPPSVLSSGQLPQQQH